MKSNIADFLINLPCYCYSIAAGFSFRQYYGAADCRHLYFLPAYPFLPFNAEMMPKMIKSENIYTKFLIFKQN